MNMDEYQKVKGMRYEQYCSYLQEKYGTAYPKGKEETFMSGKKETIRDDGLCVHSKAEGIYSWKETLIPWSWKTEIEMYPYTMPRELLKGSNVVYCDALEHLLLHVMIYDLVTVHRPWDPTDDLLSMIAELIDFYSGWMTPLPNRFASHTRISNNEDVFIEIVKQLIITGFQHGVYITEQELFTNHLDFLTDKEWDHDLNIPLQKKIVTSLDGSLWEMMNEAVNNLIAKLSQECGRECSFVRLGNDKFHYHEAGKQGKLILKDFSKQLVIKGCVDPNKYLTAVLSGKTGGMFNRNKLYSAVATKEPGFEFGSVWNGNQIPVQATNSNNTYFLRFRCSFQLKPGYSPFVRIRSSYYYDHHKDLVDSKPTVNGRKVSMYVDPATGEKITDEVALLMTADEFRQFTERYTYQNFKILDGVFFCKEG